MSPPVGLGRALGEFADIVAKVAANAVPNQEYCSSFLLPRSLFEREVIEAMEVGWGIRRAATCGELIRIDFDVSDFSVGALDIRKIVRMYVAPLVECFGGVVQDTSEGLVVLSGDQSAIESNCHGNTIGQITREMIIAGVSAIEPYDLQDAADGYLGRDELVSAIFHAMYQARQRDV